jgi:hypothetical protein
MDGWMDGWMDDDDDDDDDDKKKDKMIRGSAIKSINSFIFHTV